MQYVLHGEDDSANIQCHVDKNRKLQFRYDIILNYQLL